MERYIGLDAHASSCTAAVVGPSGRRLRSQVLETNARSLIDFLKTVPKPRHLCLEEGSHAGWLYEILGPHVETIVVAGVDQSRGPKDDKRDAFGLAEGLRIGAIKTQVYKELGRFKLLRELSRTYSMVVSDSVRVQNRIKSLYRSRGVPTVGEEVYGSSAQSTRSRFLRFLAIIHIRATVRQSRGLNRGYNRGLKNIFKGAATSVIGLARADDPLFQHYQRLLDGGTKPNLAKLTLARQIASIVLSMWRSEEVYDPAKLKRT